MSYVPPWALAMRVNSKISYLGGMVIPDSVEDRMEWIFGQLHTMRGGLLALAIAHETGSEAAPIMRIQCEHREGPAFGVSVGWRREWNDKVTLEAYHIESIDRAGPGRGTGATGLRFDVTMAPPGRGPASAGGVARSSRSSSGPVTTPAAEGSNAPELQRATPPRDGPSAANGRRSVGERRGRGSAGRSGHRGNG